MRWIAFLVVICSSGFIWSQEEQLYPQAIFSGKYFIEENESGQFGVKDLKGNVLVPFVYNRIVEHPEGLIVFKKNKTSGYERTYSSGYFNKALKLILPCNYSSIVPSEGGMLVACQNKDRKYGLVDTSGRIYIPFQYDDLHPESDNLLCAKRETKYGYLDAKGKTIIPFKFNFARSFSEGLAVATTGTLFGFIDKRGHFTIDEKFTGANDFQFGYAEVFINDEASCVNIKGELIFPFIFRSLVPVGNNQFIFEAPDTYRGQLQTLLKTTPISDKLDQTIPFVEPKKEMQNTDDLYADEMTFEFIGIVNKDKQVIGGEYFRSVHLLKTEKLINYYAVQSVNEIKLKENWNYALLAGNGSFVTEYRFLEIAPDEQNEHVYCSEEIDEKLVRRELFMDGTLGKEKK